MAIAYNDKMRLREELARVRAMGLGGDSDKLLDLVAPMLAPTDAEVFAYESVLPALPSGEWVCAADVVESLGLGASSRRSVSSALARLVKDGHATSRKESTDIVTLYMRTEEE